MIRRICITSVLLLSIGIVAEAQDWPQWRGPGREGISKETGLLKKWPEGGPKVVWQVDTVGVGYSSPSIKDGKIYTQGDLHGIEHVLCLNAEDGRVLWAVQPEPVKKALEARVDGELKRMDRNQDGSVDEAEALARLGWNFNAFDRKDKAADAEKLAASRTAFLFKTLDANGDGALSYTEAGKLMRDSFARIDRSSGDPEKLAASRAEAYLKAMDKDGDGKIERKDTRGSALDRLFNRADQRKRGERRGDGVLTREEIIAYLTKYEKGRDGVLSQDELTAYYSKNHAGGDGTLSRDELKSYYGGYRNGQGDGPRGTPTVEGDRVYVEGGNGDVSCHEAATGRTIWHVNLVSKLGGRRPGWGYSESPLIEGDLVIVTPGGKDGTVAALNKMTGEVVWQSEGTKQGAHYASPVVADIGGIRQVVQFARTSMFGVDLKDGRFLWEYTGANNGTANCCTAVVYKNHVFASSAYGTGGGLARISTVGSTQTAAQVYFEKKIGNHHGGIVRVGDYMYSLGSGTLICMEFLTGKIMWQERSVGKGSLIVADGMLYLLSERHQVGLAEATPEGYREHGRFKIESHGRPSWAHPVVAGGRLYIRDQESLTAYDIKAK